jgi:hypothetical protein
VRPARAGRQDRPHAPAADPAAGHLRGGALTAAKLLGETHRPNDAALLRLAGMLLLEQNDEWLVGRRYLSETSMTLVLAAATDHNRDREEVLELTAS